MLAHNIHIMYYPTNSKFTDILYIINNSFQSPLDANHTASVTYGHLQKDRVTEAGYTDDPQLKSIALLQ